MARKKGRGWHGDPGRHADAARGIKTKRLTPSEKELRKATQEFLAEPTVVEKEVRKGPQEIVEVYEGWHGERVRHSWAAKRMKGIRQDALDDALEAVYAIGFAGIARDVERGNLDKAIQDLSREIIAEEDRPGASGARAEDLRKAREWVKTL